MLHPLSSDVVATNCVIVLLWARGDSSNVSAACHIDGLKRAESLRSLVLEPAQDTWKRHNPTATSKPAWQVSLLGAYDALEDEATVAAVVELLSSSPYDYHLVHANVLQLNSYVIPTAHSAGPCRHGAACGHECHVESDLEEGPSAAPQADEDDGLPLTAPIVLHAAVDVIDGSVFVADFSWLGPDAILRAARVSLQFCV